MSGGAPRTVRVGAVDIGSNTTRLQLADVTIDGDGSVSIAPIERRTTITRLAEQVHARGILLPQAITRTRAALTEYSQLARRHGAALVLAAATSAVRDADNGEAFLGEVEHSFGFRAELLPGEDEAAATLEGVLADPHMREQLGDSEFLLVDIGGGSTEIVLAHGANVRDRVSLQLGSVRLTELFLHADPPSPDEITRARAYAREAITGHFGDPPPQAPAAVAVAGTSTTVAAIHLGLPEYDADLVHGTSLGPTEVSAVVRRLSEMPLAERERLPGLEPKRAPVIVGGLVVLEAVLEAFDVRQVTVSEADILDGITLRAARTAIAEGITELPQPFGGTPC